MIQLQPPINIKVTVVRIFACTLLTVEVAHSLQAS